MRVLVTGSEGSLMQVVIPLLLEAGHYVRGVDNFFRYGRIDKQRSYEFVEGDLCDPALARRACQGMEVIIQAAARIFGAGGFRKYPADILAYDTALHHNILRGALETGIRKVVYISSSMVYERATRVPSKEEDVEDMPVPLTDYGLSKLMCERLCRAFQKQWKLTYTIWRPFNIITPLEKGEEEPGISHVFADLIRKIVLNKQNPVPVFGDGRQVRCFTWIEDVARAMAEYSFDPRTDNQAFNLGNPKPITVCDLALLIHRIAVEKGLLESGELAFDLQPGFPDDVRVRIPSIDKASQVLGWEPSIGLEEALTRCIEVAIGIRSEKDWSLLAETDP